MALTLSIVSYKNQPVAPPRAESFGDGIVTIGRTPGNKLVLPDPESFVSKEHCLIAVQGAVCRVTDRSSNGTFINLAGEPLGRERSAMLQDGDRLRIGEYEVLVRIGPEVERASAAPFAAPGAEPAGDPFGLDHLVGAPSVPPGGGAPPASPFDDLLGLRNPAAGAPAPPLPAAGPLDLDALFPADPLLGPGDPGAASPSLSSDPQWPFPAAGQSAGWPATPSDHAPPEQQFFRPQAVAPAPIPEDWDPLGPAPGTESRSRVPDLPAGERTILPGRAAPAAAGGFGAVPLRGAGPADPAAPGARGAGASGAAAALMAGAGGDPLLLHAFLEGAGLPAAASAGENPVEAMRRMGALVRDMIAGLAELLATRSMIKAEYRLDHTQIGARNNNPLKVVPTVEEALTIILGPPRPGYMPGQRAVQEGFRDVKAHELALMAGMQAAAAALLRQFDPQSLKQRLDKASLLRSLMPGARNAKYWEVYEQQYRQIAGEVSEDVRGIFGRAFAQAYEEQIKKL